MLIFYQLINNLFSRASRPEPRLGRRWKELKHIARGRVRFSPHYFWSSSITETFFYKSSFTAKKKSKLIGRLSNFTNSFIPLCDDQMSDVDDLLWFHQHAPCCCGKISFKVAWQIQMPYMDIIRVVHYNLNVPYLWFHLHPLEALFAVQSHLTVQCHPVYGKQCLCNLCKNTRAPNPTSQLLN